MNSAHLDEWGPTVPVPMRILRTLLVAQASSSGHYKLCENSASTALMGHPGDPLGRVLSWLWSAGRQDDCVRLVTDYLAEMREHNPHRPDMGERLTWDELKTGLRHAADPKLTEEQSARLVEFLEVRVPRQFGSALKRLNSP